MQTIVITLAVLGAAALGYRLIRSLARLGLAFAEGTAASSLAEISARRGDISTLAERRRTQRTARRQARVDACFAALWLLWLLVPPIVSWVQPFYAAAAALWLLPVRPVRFQPSDSSGT